MELQLRTWHTPGALPNFLFLSPSGNFVPCGAFSSSLLPSVLERRLPCPSGCVSLFVDYPTPSSHSKCRGLSLQGGGLYLGCESFCSVFRSLGNGSPCLVCMVGPSARARAAMLGRSSTALGVLPTVSGSATSGVHPVGDSYSHLSPFRCTSCLQVWCMEAVRPTDLSRGVCVYQFLSS